MNTIKLRKWAFACHRYIGLFVGLLLIVIGLTGSILVFQKEIDTLLISQRFGQVIPQVEQVPLGSVLANVKEKLKDKPELALRSIATPLKPDKPYEARLQSKDKKLTQVFVNPYTGAIMGVRDLDSSWNMTLRHLHYQFLAGQIGEVVVGIVALLLFILCLTGLILWTGWRKLRWGFKIKIDAHPLRMNFDIHKVSGMVTVIFLTVIAFTGFCWNFSDQTKPFIYAATFTPEPPKPVSKPIEANSPLSIAELLQKADAIFPNSITTFVSLPQKPKDPIRIGKKQAEESEERGATRIWLDQYSGAVLQIQDGLNLSGAERVLNSFPLLHYGTFLGIPSRILYVFVGLAPSILAITGFTIFRFRHWGKERRNEQ